VLPDTPTVKLRRVQIIVDISLDEDDRAVGTVRAVGHTQSRAFSGNLELLALIENLYRTGQDTPSGGSNEKELS
jgi:hypothetical protein